MTFSIGFITIFVLTFDPHAILAQLKLFPPWITVVQHVNESYSVKCEGEGEKIWRHENEQIGNDHAGPSVSVTKKSSENNALYLRFNKIQKEFKGYYNCSANIKGKKYNKGFELIVIKPVTFITTKTTELLVYNEGEEIILNCDTEGEPPPIISWFFNKELILETNNARVQRNNSLKISKALWKNSGTYTCRAFQEILQTRDAELIYDVKIRHQPMSYTGQTNTTIYGFHNESKNITCQVYSYPVAYFIWYRDKVPIDPKKHRVKVHNDENISILEVPLISDEIWGMYDCEAANPLGFLIHTFNLEPISKPVIPRLLIYEYSDSAAVISILIEPYPIYSFICHLDYTKYTYCSYEEKWRRGFSLECKNERIKNTNKTHCKLDHLKPLTKYAVRATIVNDGGSGRYSSELIFRTRKESPILLGTSFSTNLEYSFALLSCSFVFAYLRLVFFKY